MIPKAEGDSTPLGQRPLCVLPVVHGLWASVRLAHSGLVLFMGPRFSLHCGEGVSSGILSKLVGLGPASLRCV